MSSIWIDIKRTISWIWNHSERITSVLALMVSTVAIFQGVKAIDLANDGILIARKTQEEEKRSFTLQTAAYLQIEINGKERTIKLSNYGLDLLLFIKSIILY